MKRVLLAAVIFSAGLFLNGCGGSDSGTIVPVTFDARIISDPVYDGDIEQISLDSYNVVQGMSPTVQSVFAGINPGTLTEFRAFLDFPLRESSGVPYNAIIGSAFLDIFITDLQSTTGRIPIRIDLVNFQPPDLLASDYDRILQPPLQSTTIFPQITPADIGKHVVVDVTPLMIEAQHRGLPDFQVRILEELGNVPPGRIEINDTTGGNRDVFAPLLTVSYF